MKDTNNLLNFNYWSAGEYENKLNYMITIDSGAIITNEYSDIGESSIKQIRTADGASGGSYIRINYNNSIINKTITASATIKTTDYDVDVIIGEKADVTNAYSTVVPANSCRNVSVSLVSSSSNTSFFIQVNNRGNKNSVVYVDNISLFSS